MGRLGPIESDPDANVLGEEQRFAVCDVCGQIFDLRDGTQLSHHGGDDHAPLLAKQDD